jgi:hypothetical protein
MEMLGIFLRYGGDNALLGLLGLLNLKDKDRKTLQDRSVVG